MRRAITDNAGNLFISAITSFEIGIKHRRRGMDLPLPPADWIARALEHHRVQEIPVHGRIAERSTSLPPLHRDPADRIIIATSLITAVSILPPDRQISQYPDVAVVWDSG